MNMRMALLLGISLTVMLTAPATLNGQVTPGTIVLRGAMSGGQEVPPVAPGTGAGGYTECTLNLAALEADCLFAVINIPSGATLAHIHVGGPEVSGPVMVNIAIPLQFSNDLEVRWRVTPDNIIFRPDTGIRSAQDFFQAGAAGLWYVNVHTNNTPSGEVRGQLCPEARVAGSTTALAVCTTPRPASTPIP
jgi:hypothetical protein